jgi:hypothetical protein
MSNPHLISINASDDRTTFKPPISKEDGVQDLRQLLFTAAILAVAWSVSSAGYFWSESVLNTEIGYNEAPLIYATYYALWAAFVFWIFRGSLATPTGFQITFEQSIWAVSLLIAMAVFLLLVLPRLPETAWTRAETPVEFFHANSWYFIPKSTEIVFQQTLIAALVFALNDYKLKLPMLSLVTAMLFGGFHLTLAIAYDNPLYVLRYAIAATMFGAIVPYLILKVRNGFFVSFAIHCAYYAIDITLIHFYFSATSARVN